MTREEKMYLAMKTPCMVVRMNDDEKWFLPASLVPDSWTQWGLLQPDGSVVEHSDFTTEVTCSE